MSIYQHYREDERPFVDQVLGWQDEVKQFHQVCLSDFLDPRQQKIVESIIGQDDEVKLEFLGGSFNSERRRARLIPSYLESVEEDFQLTLFTINYPMKFVTLQHRDILGAIMNLGLKREKFGDIIVGEQAVQIVVASEVADYIELNIDKIGQATVRLQRTPLSELVEPKEEWFEATTTVSSMRLDTVISQLYSLSRTRIGPYIDKGLVKVNWKVIDQTHFLLEDGDYISVRGFGRIQLIAILGTTKKDKFRLQFRRLK